MKAKTRTKGTSDFGLYWTDYGKIPALLKSGYFRSSLILTAICFPLWLAEGWWEVVISVVPSLTGFSLAAFAMLIAFGNERFLKVITTPISSTTENDEGEIKPSVYLTTGAAFVHFIVVQSLALLSAIICKACYKPVWSWFADLVKPWGLNSQLIANCSRVFWGIAFLLFVYGVLCGLAATMRIYRMSRWYAKMMQIPASDNPKQ